MNFVMIQYQISIKMPQKTPPKFWNHFIRQYSKPYI